MLLQRLKNLRFTSIRQKLIAGLLLLGIFPLACVSYFAYERSRKALSEEAVQKLVLRARNVAETVDERLNWAYENTVTLALNGALLGSRDTVTAIANQYVTHFGLYDLLLVADLSGKVIAVNTVDENGLDLDLRIARPGCVGTGVVSAGAVE